MITWKQREENNNIARNASRSDILTLTLLSADAKSTVLLRVPSLTKVEERNFSLLYFLRWLCLIHGQLAMFLRLVKRLVIFKCQCFCLFDIQQLSVLSKHYFLWNSPPRRDSAEFQFLRLHSPFLFTKILKALQIFNLLHFGGTSKGPPKNFLYWYRQTDVTETSARHPFRGYFLKCFSLSLFFQYWL